MAKRKLIAALAKKAMAKKRGYKKRGYKKRPTNTSSFKSNFAKITRNPLGQTQICTLPYVESAQWSAVTGARGVYTYRLNDCYDPNVTGVGHQPLGFDQMSAVFGRYTVIGAQCKLTFWNRDVDNMLGFAIHLSEQATPPGNMSQLIELGAIQYKFIPPSGTGYEYKQHTMYVNVGMKKFFKLSSLLDNNDVGNISTGSSPARPLYMHLLIWLPDGEITTATGSFQLEMRQRVVFTVPNNLAQS